MYQLLVEDVYMSQIVAMVVWVFPKNYQLYNIIIGGRQLFNYALIFKNKMMCDTLKGFRYGKLCSTASNIHPKSHAVMMQRKSRIVQYDGRIRAV